MIPVVMTGILGIYGLIIWIILLGKIKYEKGFNYQKGFAIWFSGLIVGLSALAAGYAIGDVGDQGVRGMAR